MADADYEEPRFDEDERRGYDSRDRSRSPGRDGGDSGVRARSASPNGRDRYESRNNAQDDNRSDDANVNPGSNLFVTGIAPRLSEEEVTAMFGKYGEVEKCNIMRDPHTGDSRGFGFVKMVNSDGAEAARDALSGQNIEGRTLSVEKARRGRPRTPTPGKYYGPPKREGGGFRGGRGGGRRFDSYDRRGGDDRGYGGRRDDYGGGGYRGGRDRGSYRGDRYEDRGYGGGSGGGGGGGDNYYGGGGGGSGYGGSGGSRGYGRERDYDGGRERVDRYASGPPRDDRRGYGGGEERRGYGGSSGGGGGGGGYPREDRGAPGYGDAPPRDREAYQGSRA